MCQKSESYTTEKNTHDPSFNTSLLSLLHPIIKKEKALHLVKVSSGTFINFVFRKTDIPRSSLHHNLVLQGAGGNRAVLGHPWLEEELNKPLTAGNILPHGE